MAYVRLITVLLAALLAMAVSCGSDDLGSSSDPVSVVRLRLGEKVEGGCRFLEDISLYPVAYRTNHENCWQAVTIGPLGRAELEEMKQDVPLFWEKSSPYQQALVGERIDGECKFDSPAVRAYLEFSTTASTDWEDCIMIVDVGPVTEEQVEAVQRPGGTHSSETALPAPSSPVPTTDE